MHVRLLAPAGTHPSPPTPLPPWPCYSGCCPARRSSLSNDCNRSCSHQRDICIEQECLLVVQAVALANDTRFSRLPSRQMPDGSNDYNLMLWLTCLMCLLEPCLVTTLAPFDASKAAFLQAMLTVSAGDPAAHCCQSFAVSHQQVTDGHGSHMVQEVGTMLARPVMHRCKTCYMHCTSRQSTFKQCVWLLCTAWRQRGAYEL